LHATNSNGQIILCISDDKNIIMIKSPQMEHTTSFMPIANGNVYDSQSLPSESVAESLQQQQQKESQLLSQRKRDNLVITPKMTSQLHSSEMDTTLAKVIVVQAHVRGHLTRKHLEPLKVQTRAATTIQAYWYSKFIIVYFRET